MCITKHFSRPSAILILMVFFTVIPLNSHAQSIVVTGLEILGPDGTLISAQCEANSEGNSCRAQVQQEQATDPVKIQKIKRQLESEKKKVSAQKAKVLQETRRKVAEMIKEANLDKAKKVDKLFDRIKELRLEARLLKKKSRDLRAALRSLKSCKKQVKKVCQLGSPPQKCAPEGCYGSDFGENFLDNTGNGDASFAPSVVRVGDIITATAFAYDAENYGVSIWPSNIGEQIGECSFTSTSCSWRVTSPTNGWRIALFGITGYFGTGFEEVPFAVLP